MIGTTIGHYTIEQKLGEGGMGVVYKARDTKLDREVALKFLPESAPSGADGSRFLQEAKAAAALNHPNICTIHGIEEADDPSSALGTKRSFIVMEFVDGQMLEEKKSALSQKQAIEIGIQIAEGLAAAHEHGIVHRDIKPENIMIRKDGRVQIMDFGLAKLRGASRLTKEGSTVGTAGYMSPEQVQGQETDQRSDIFSLGVLLFEMLTGHAPFKGMHETAIAYEIVNVDSPPMSSLKPEIPPELDAIVLDCLEKDPKERTQSAGQVALELKRFRRESSRSRASRIMPATPHRPASSVQPSTAGSEEVSEGASVARRLWPLKTILLVTGIPLAAAAGYLVAALVGGPSPDQVTLRAIIEPPPGQQVYNDFGGYLALSPDGSNLVFAAIDSGGSSRLWLRPLSSTEAKPLSGTEGASYPFWSPDGKEIAFFANTKLRKIDLLGSPPLDIADVQQGRGGAWGPDGTIIVSPIIGETNLYSVPSGGGMLKRLTSFDSTSKYYPRYPSFLPDGKHFLYVGYAGGGAIAARTAAFVGSLDGTVTELPIRGSSNLFYSAGHLLYLRENTLIAQAFDPSGLKLTGDPVPIDKGIQIYPARAKGNFTASPNDVVVYVRDQGEPEGSLVWIDRNGRATEIVRGRPTLGARLSPDGTKFAYSERDDQSNSDIWIYDLTRHIKTRFTFSPDPDVFPAWTPDGHSIVYNTVHGTDWNVVVKSADGTGGDRVIYEGKDTELQVSDVSSDGHSILFSRQTLVSGFDVIAGDLSKPGVLDTILSTRFHEYISSFSPDGKWICYQSDASGRYEVYVRRFARESEKWQVSTMGGQFPSWMRNGEIAFLSNGKTVVSRVTFSDGFPRFSVPSELFSLSGDVELNLDDATADGKRFIGSRTKTVAGANALTVISNWHRLIEKK